VGDKMKVILEKPVTVNMSSSAVRIIAIQLLFLGLLFLPNYSSYTVPLASREVSMVMYTLSQFMNNPAFYILLIIVAVIFTFSFKLNLDSLIGNDGSVTVGSIFLQAAARVLGLYIGLFFVSWLFLVYKLMFMDTIYINSLIFRAL
jgi:hypothetical protein